MGSQVAKSCFIISCIALILGSSIPARSMPQIPENTMQAAYSGGYSEIRKAPESEIIRVGIGDNSFSRYDYDKTTIYGTSEIKIYENGIFIEIGNGLLKIFQAVCQIVKTGELVKALYSQKI